MIPFCILVIENDDDREFMAALFIQYQRLLYKEIYDILKNPWNTEDVLQATLVKLIDKIPELRNKEQPQLIGYISATARNTAYNFLRSQKKIVLFSFEEYMQQSEPIVEHRQMEDLLISKEEIDELVRRWPQLDAKSKYLLEGKYILGKSDEVMAEELSIKTRQCPNGTDAGKTMCISASYERANPESFMMNGSGFVAFDRLLCLIFRG